MKILKKIRWWWKMFWGHRYFIFDGNDELGTILVYGHKIYILEKKEQYGQNIKRDDADMES